MIQVLWLAIIALCVVLVVAGWSWVPWIAGGSIVGVLSLWVLISVFWPAAPDRRCPRCRRAGLVKIERGAPGVRCTLCGFCDENLHVAYLDEW